MPGGDNTKMAFFQDHLYLGTAVEFPEVNGERIARIPIASIVPDTCIHVGPTGLSGQVALNSVDALVVMPNPATEQFTIALPAGFTTGVTLVYDVAGNLVRSYPAMQGAPSTYTVFDLAAGTYVLELRDDLGPRWTARFTKVD